MSEDFSLDGVTAGDIEVFQGGHTLPEGLYSATVMSREISDHTTKRGKNAGNKGKKLQFMLESFRADSSVAESDLAGIDLGEKKMKMDFYLPSMLSSLKECAQNMDVDMAFDDAANMGLVVDEMLGQEVSFFLRQKEIEHPSGKKKTTINEIQVFNDIMPVSGGRIEQNS